MLDNRPIPPEAAPLVADIARLPFSHKRYQRAIGEALTRAQIGRHLHEQGLRGTARDPYRVNNVAGRAAALIWAQRDRVAAGEAFERRHDAELVEQALLEHEAREQLRADGWKGARLEAEVGRLVEITMREGRGSYGRPSDEYPTQARFAVDRARVVLERALPVRVEMEEGLAEEEAAEIESAESAPKGASR
jgi:hypothetical protein